MNPNIQQHPGVFSTPWEYECVLEANRKTFHVWSCQHREGYTAFALTHQPAAGSRLSFVKPTGTSHYTSWEALRKTYPNLPAQP